MQPKPIKTQSKLIITALFKENSGIKVGIIYMEHDHKIKMSRVHKEIDLTLRDFYFLVPY